MVGQHAGADGVELACGHSGANRGGGLVERQPDDPADRAESLQLLHGADRHTRSILSYGGFVESRNEITIGVRVRDKDR